MITNDDVIIDVIALYYHRHTKDSDLKMISPLYWRQKSKIDRYLSITGKPFSLIGFAKTLLRVTTHIRSFRFSIPRERKSIRSSYRFFGLTTTTK